MDSIRDALTKAYDKAETDSTKTDDEAHSSPSPAADEGTAGGGELPSRENEGAGLSTDTPEAAPSASAAPAAAASTPEVPAPASWSNEERAAWATVPAAARAAIQRREGEMSRALQVSATARRRVDALEAMAQPYRPLLDSYGITVEQAMPGLLATRAALEVGTPAQKAELVANLCADFGIEVDLLDGALSKRYANGQPAPRYQPQNYQVDLSNNPQLAPLFQIAEQFKAAQTERAQTAIAAVASDPHYNTVRFTMADLIEKAREQGRSLDLPAALRLAKEFHGITGPAPAPMSASDAGRALAAARNAASSVSGAPKPTPTRKPGEGSLRQELEANYAAGTRR